eukprot:s2333_g3.t1
MEGGERVDSGVQRELWRDNLAQLRHTQLCLGPEDIPSLTDLEQGTLIPSRTTIGSRPGDSFADTVFAFLFARVLQNFQGKLVEHDLHDTVPCHTHFDPFDHGQPEDGAPIPYMGPVWMGDLRVCFSAGSPTAVINKATVATSLLLDTLEHHAMRPNLKPGKTELLVSLRGRGVRKWKVKLFGTHGTHKLPIVCEHKMRELLVVGQYQHLGGVLHHGGDHRCEVRRRIAMAHQTFNAMSGSIFHNQAIVFVKMVQLFQSLILSRLLYGCESWVLRTWKHKHMLHAAIIKLYKRVFRIPHDAAVEDDEVCVRIDFPTPTELLRRARLRYLGTLHRCADSVTWSVLHSDSAWCALVRDDLIWMWRQRSSRRGRFFFLKFLLPHRSVIFKLTVLMGYYLLLLVQALQFDLALFEMWWSLTRRQRSMHGESFRQTALHASANVDQEDADALAFPSVEALKVVLTHLADSEQWPFLDAVVAAPRPVRTVVDLENEFMDSSVPLQAPRPQRFGKHRLVWHAFSGRRRHGDFQEFFEACVARHPGLLLHVVFVDIVLSPQWGDVTKL